MNNQVHHLTDEDNHYQGLVAQWYDQLLQSEGRDIEYYTRLATRQSGRVLELACGTGRILVPICLAGTSIDGVDLSEEMLTLCRSKCDTYRLSPGIYRQDMVRFDLPHQYDLIFIAGGSFQLLSDREDVASCLSHIYHHLRPGGRLVMDLFVPAEPHTDDPDFKPGRSATRDPDEQLCCHYKIRYDAKEQLMHGHYRYDHFRGDQLIQSETDAFDLRWYMGGEIETHLSDAGFSDVRAQWAPIITTHQETTVYTAFRPV
jgi:SAM-dependent methyltransferase